jgi:type IV secretory pathway VirB6-like protein
MHYTINKRLIFSIAATLFIAAGLWLVSSQLAFAAAPPPAVPHGTCTTDPTFNITGPGTGGLISTVMMNIRTVLDSVTSAMYNAIALDTGFRESISIAASLYVSFYGIMFMFGMVQISLFDFVIRMIKVGLIALLFSGASWAWFGDVSQPNGGIVIKFFNSGTDDFINALSAYVLGLPAPPSGSPAFAPIDTALSKAISAKMAVTLLATFFTMPYGPIFGLLMALSLGTFVRAIMNAAMVYLMSLILKSLLFGIAPIFLSFILFNRTRHLFDGWLNQVVNATLQPILLFTFFGFFVKLIEVCIDNLLVTPVCWTEWNESLRGSPFAVHFWRFATCDGGGTCEPYGGKYSFDGPTTQSGSGTGGPIFPIDILGVLVLVMLADLCARFNAVVISIASDLAGASTRLDEMMQGAMGDWFNKVGRHKGADGGGLGGGGLGGGGRGGGGAGGAGNIGVRRGFGASGGARKGAPGT